MSNQHGCRRARGVHTAIYDIISYLRKHPEYVIFEFDFKSFFNYVRPSRVYQILRRRSNLLSGLISRIICNTKYDFVKIAKEEELIFGLSKKNMPMFMRRGLPQGLSISPLLATLALEETQMPKGLFMYVDDGIYIGKEDSLPSLYN